MFKATRQEHRTQDKEIKNINMASEDHNYVGKVTRKLEYSVHKCSSFSSTFVPQ